MKIFAIRNHDLGDDRDLGFFFYHEHGDGSYIELMEDVDEWDLPFILDHYARAGRRTVSPSHTLAFIRQRVIPSDRQNIGMILRDNGLETYDEFRLFILSDGRCAQDECYIRQISPSALPESILLRRRRRLISAATANNGSWLLGFADGRTALLEPETCRRENTVFERLLRYRRCFDHLQLTEGGAALSPDGQCEITYDLLYEHSSPLPFDMKTLEAFALSQLVTAPDLAQQLDCSRQNISDLVRRGRLEPLPLNARVQIFSKTACDKLMYEINP